MKILWTLSIMFIANHLSAMTPNTFDNFSHLPAYNEQERIEATLRRYVERFEQAVPGHEEYNL